MMMQHHGQSKEFDLALEYLNYVFTGIFTLEAIIRLTAMRLEYFKSGMNVFDFVIVIFSIAGKSQCLKSPPIQNFYMLIRYFFINSCFQDVYSAAMDIRGFYNLSFCLKNLQGFLKHFN